MKELSQSQMQARAKYLGNIRDARKKFYEDFPDGCRIKFDRGPSTDEDPTIRTGKGRILSKRDLYDGRETRVKYVLDDWQPGKVQECGIVTFLKDNPVRIEED